MNEDLVSLLRCPLCGPGHSYTTAFLFNPEKALRCARCGAEFPIREGIPRFVDEAVDAGFDERWKKYPKVQATTAGIFEQKTGFRPADLAGKVVLDAGCGCGRFLAVAQSMGAKAIGVDGSPHALKAAAENAPGAGLLQANLLSLPLPDESFDHAFSIGVLHHTESTKRAFLEVARKVKRGGQFAVWVYCKPVTDNRLLPAYELLHEITKACPPEKLHAAFEKWAVATRNAYAGAWGPLEQVLRVSGSKDDSECVSDTLDWHTPQYRFWHDIAEVKGWFVEAGYEVDRVGTFPTSVRGVKR
jgi:ubiquinone/menaquinone biosynthesis C-methylase UbiE